MDTPKERILRRFLAFLSRYRSLPEARLATLGGNGTEARLWAESKIDHGWLIELNRKLRGRLIEEHGYKIHNRLGTFHQILGGYGGDEGIVDGFHLDLCGTMREGIISDFTPILPLIFKSKGRCLAITVADARRNLALEDWPTTKERALELFGKRSRGILRSLEAQARLLPVRRTDHPAWMKPFNPAKAAKREFAMLVTVGEILLPYRWTPVAMERYVYVSSYQGHRFRMRTYLFHFERKNADAPSLTDVWKKSPLYFDTPEEMLDIDLQKPHPSVHIPQGVPMLESKLGEVARLFGGATAAEYEDLLGKSQQLSGILAIIGKNVIPGTEQAMVPKIVTTPAQNGGPQKKKRKLTDLPEKEQIEWLLETLELRAQNDQKWLNGSWEARLRESFGQFTPPLSKSIRATLARTSGGHRKSFEARIHSAFGDKAKPYLDRLSKL
ncbi:MAG: hypothetical protein JWN50_473 [Parcubacteria group bacterium]|nr:hypothetical protein [Parcubacteria group bacterium]